MSSNEQQELATQLYAAQQRLQKQQQQRQMVAARSSSLQKSVSRAQLTMKELETLDENTRCYKQIGRAFLLSTRSGVISSLKDSTQQSEKQLKTMAETAKMLEKQVVDSEKEAEALYQQLQRSS